MNYTVKGRHTHPTKARWKYTDEELVQSARRFKHRSEWKRGAPNHYQAATLRGILNQCCAHMKPASHPYAGDYVIYAYEFDDKHAYIGLTFLPEMRRTMHKLRGPVALHAAICSNYTHKQLETGLQTPEAAAAAEAKWIEKYRNEGWTLLNKNRAGGLGTVQARRWTKEAVMAEAKKYQTRQEWIDKSQMSYRIAKREGWFDEASAHMPKRQLGVGVGRVVSQATRDKQSAAKAGKTQSDAVKLAKSASIKKWWAGRKASKVVEALLSS